MPLSPQSPSSPHNEQDGKAKDFEVLCSVASQFLDTKKEVDRVNKIKKAYSSKITKCKSAARRVLKRKFTDAKAVDENVDTVSIKSGNVVFRLDEVVSCPSCSTDDMPAFFEPQNIQRYIEAKTTKRCKLSIEEAADSV